MHFKDSKPLNKPASFKLLRLVEEQLQVAELLNSICLRPCGSLQTRPAATAVLAIRSHQAQAVSTEQCYWQLYTQMPTRQGLAPARGRKSPNTGLHLTPEAGRVGTQGSTGGRQGGDTGQHRGADDVDKTLSLLARCLLIREEKELQGHFQAQSCPGLR